MKCRENRNESEVLLHHPQAESHRLSRRRDCYRTSINKDLTGIRVIQAVENFHQCRLTSTILTNDSVNLTALKRKVHIGIRLYFSKLFIDAAHLNDWCMFHLYCRSCGTTISPAIIFALNASTCSKISSGSSERLTPSTMYSTPPSFSP